MNNIFTEQSFSTFDRAKVTFVSVVYLHLCISVSNLFAQLEIQLGNNHRCNRLGSIYGDKHERVKAGIFEKNHCQNHFHKIKPWASTPIPTPTFQKIVKTNTQYHWSQNQYSRPNTNCLFFIGARTKFFSSFLLEQDISYIQSGSKRSDILCRLL